MFENVLYRLRDRLTKIDMGESGITINPHIAAIAQTCIDALEDPSKSTLGIKANEHYGLMQVFCH